MGLGMTLRDLRTTDATVTQRRCFASVTLNREQLTHRILNTEADWRRTGETIEGQERAAGGRP